MNKKKLLLIAGAIVLVGILVFLSVELFWYMHPDVRIGYGKPVNGYSPDKGYKSVAMASWVSHSIFGENKKIIGKVHEFSDENSAIFLELTEKYTLPCVIIEEVRNEDGGMLLTFEGWGTLSDGTRESIHREKRLGFKITDDIEKRDKSAAEMIESFGKDTELTQKVTPQLTREVTHEPTTEPDSEYDEFYSAGHAFKGVYLCDNGWSLTIEPEGAGSVIFVFEGKTDRVTFGFYHEFWTSYDGETMTFVSDGDIFHYKEDEMTTAYSEETNTFKVVGDTICWLNKGMDFQKDSDETSDNPNIVDSGYLPDYYGGDYGDGFGTMFRLENPGMIDIVATTFYGVCCESWNYSADSFYFPYYGEEMSLETMDEFNAAYLELGMDVDQGHLCFLEKGINSDVTWKLEDGKIYVTNLQSGDIYEGLFYHDPESHNFFISLRIDEYDIWMTYNTVVHISVED